MWFLGIEPRSSGLVASPFIPTQPSCRSNTGCVYLFLQPNAGCVRCMGKIDSYELASLQESGCQSSADGKGRSYGWYGVQGLSRPKYQGKQRALLGLGPANGNEQGGPGRGKRS